MVLLLHRHVGVPAQQGQHIRPYTVELAVEFVAELVDPFHFLGECFLVAGVEHLEKAIVLRVEAAAGIVVDGVDTGFELTQRRCVTERGTLFDQSLDQRARGQDFQLDLPAQRVVPVAQRGVLAGVVRRLDFFDDDPAYRKRPLQRADVGAREVAIGGHVAVGQLFDPLADLHHQHHGHDRGNGHQHDQRHGDSHDLSSDRQRDHPETSFSKPRGTEHIEVMAMAVSASGGFVSAGEQLCRETLTATAIVRVPQTTLGPGVHSEITAVLGRH